MGENTVVMWDVVVVGVCTPQASMLSATEKGGGEDVSVYANTDCYDMSLLCFTLT